MALPHRITKEFHESYEATLETLVLRSKLYVPSQCEDCPHLRRTVTELRKPLDDATELEVTSECVATTCTRGVEDPEFRKMFNGWHSREVIHPRFIITASQVPDSPTETPVPGWGDWA